MDELYVQIAPVLLGGGKRLFTALPHRQTLKLVATHQYGPLAEVVYHLSN